MGQVCSPVGLVYLFIYQTVNPDFAKTNGDLIGLTGNIVGIFHDISWYT
jgi:hypothetical protein